MDGFKNTTKIQYFKTGGSVQAKNMCYGGKMKKGGEVDAEDIKQDKAIVKKAFAMHDKQEHHGEKTDLSKLRKGGRAKKEQGTVKKYKTGGQVENQYAAKKTDKDLKDIANTKRQKPAFLCGGKSVRKMAGGRSVDAPVDVKDPQALVDKIAREENEADAAIIPNAIKKAGELGGRAVKAVTGMFKDKEVPAKRTGGKVAKKC